jgi:hypothetical protein
MDTVVPLQSRMLKLFIKHQGEVQITFLPLQALCIHAVIHADALNRLSKIAKKNIKLQNTII